LIIIGQKRYEVWSLNGKEHREDGPSIQYWYENGQIGYKWWYLKGLALKSLSCFSLYFHHLI